MLEESIIRLSQKFFSIFLFFFFFFLSPDLSRFSRIFILILWIMEMDWILIVGMYAGGTFVSLQNCFIRNTFD